MLKKVFTALIVALVLGGLAGCASEGPMLEVLDHPDYNISTLKTYRWKDEPVVIVGQLAGAESIQLEVRVKNVVNNLMASKGYVQTESDPDIDLAVMIGAVTMQAYSEHVYNTNRYYDAQFRWSQVNDYLRGAVSIVMTAPGGEDIMWQGTAGENLHADSRRNQGTIEKFVAMVGESMPASR